MAASSCYRWWSRGREAGSRGEDGTHAVGEEPLDLQETENQQPRFHTDRQFQVQLRPRKGGVAVMRTLESTAETKRKIAANAQKSP